jgi:hypothetical protein
MARMKFYGYTFQVKGRGYFPTDMLRYDRAVFRTQDAVMAAAYRGPETDRTVDLVAYVPVGNVLEPTEARWKSFGWNVVADSVKPIME